MPRHGYNLPTNTYIRVPIGHTTTRVARQFLRSLMGFGCTRQIVTSWRPLCSLSTLFWRFYLLPHLEHFTTAGLCCATEIYSTQVIDPSEESTVWSSPYGEVTGQWIAFDLRTDCPVGALRLLAMSNTTSPKQVLRASQNMSSCSLSIYRSVRCHWTPNRYFVYSTYRAGEGLG